MLYYLDKQYHFLSIFYGGGLFRKIESFLSILLSLLTND